MPGKSAEMSLIIFDRNNRRMGYGTSAFNLLAVHLKRHSIVKKIFITVRADNYGTLSFWKKTRFYGDRYSE
ncbi:MAG: GNAT family N-acetyltransferase [Thermodesulfovibrionales bacterium]